MIGSRDLILGSDYLWKICLHFFREVLKYDALSCIHLEYNVKISLGIKGWTLEIDFERQGLSKSAQLIS